MLWGIYSAIYGEVNVSVEKCVEIKGDYVEKIVKLFYICHLKKLVRPETFGPYYVRISFQLKPKLGQLEHAFWLRSIERSFKAVFQTMFFGHREDLLPNDI